MEITSRLYGDVLVVAPAGRIDHAAAGEFERSLLPLLDPACGAGAGIVLDFERVDYISSVGLRVVMMAGRAMRARGARIALAQPQPVVAEILAISRFGGVVEIFPALSAALRAISPVASAAHDTPAARG